MAKNENLHKAKDAKKDEFYTQYEDIQNELNHYEQHFRGKTVLCNCDDPFESNFCKFFLRNFNYLGLKRLICTSYGTSPVVGQQLSLFDDENEPVVRGNGYVMDIREVSMANGRGVSDEDIDGLLKSKKRGVKKLKGDGDFRSEECIAYLKQADIVVTNPPFSLFREYVAQLVAYQKNFLIIGNINAITYKEIFPLIKDNKIWLGASIHSGDRKFYVPDDYPLHAAGCGVDKNGRKYIRVKGVRWFTNLDYAIRHEELVLYKKYYGNEEDYPHYANYDAIEISKVSDIPCDYFEEIGVPITYLDKYNPEQFEIIGASRWMGKPMSEIAPKGSYVAGGVRFYLPVDCSQSVKVERERERERDRSAARFAPLSMPLRQNCHQTQSTGGCMTGSLSSVGCNGIMGVPITFLDKYNPEQFEIIGCADYTGKYGSDEIGISRIGEEWIAKYRAQGGRGHYTANMTSLVYYDMDGNAKNTFKRILIKRRSLSNEDRAEAN